MYSRLLGSRDIHNIFYVAFFFTHPVAYYRCQTQNKSQHNLKIRIIAQHNSLHYTQQDYQSSSYLLYHTKDNSLPPQGCLQTGLLILFILLGGSNEDVLLPHPSITQSADSQPTVPLVFLLCSCSAYTDLNNKYKLNHPVTR